MLTHKKLVVVLGMHRGGTSAITRSIQVLGATLGNSLMPPAADNPKGFWEDLDIFQINEELLTEFQSAWDRVGLLAPNYQLPAVSKLQATAQAALAQKFSCTNHFSLKDPRIARLLPFWQRVFSESGLSVSYVIALRNPLSVADSLAQRNGFDQIKSYLLWLEHLLAAVYHTNGQRRIVVNYDRLIDNPEATIRRMAEQLGIGSIDTEALHEYKESFLDSKMRHAHYTQQDVMNATNIPKLIQQLYMILTECADDISDINDPSIGSLTMEGQEWLRSIGAVLCFTNRLDIKAQRLSSALEADKQEIHLLTDRVVKESNNIKHIQSELDRRDTQMAAQAAEAQDLRRKLIQKNEEYTALVQAHGTLLQRRADRYARYEAAYHIHISKLSDELRELQTEVDELRERQTEVDELREHLEYTEEQLRATLASFSWRATKPIRLMAARHPGVRRVVIRSARGVRRAFIKARAASIHNSAQNLPVTDIDQPDAGLVFKQQAISPLMPSLVPVLPSGLGRRRALCVGHVFPYPPRAGNEYRIHRLLNRLADQGWDLLVVICPLPHEMPTELQLANAAAVYPNLIVCDRAGILRYHMSDGGQMLAALLPGRTMDISVLLGEDDGGDQHKLRLLSLLRTFCPDALVELLLQLQDIYRPNLFLAEYVFMTRPFELLNHDITKIVDTIDVFSTKAEKVEKHGVTDGLAMSRAEEATLLRRADILIGIQPEEAQELSSLAPDRKVISVGVDFLISEPNKITRPGATILLVASNNPMNVKGLHDFFRFSWPIVRESVPEAELLVVGSVGKSIDHVPEHVRVIGQVDNLQQLYEEARVVINPTVAGTGLKIKTVEALCHLRTVVCWPSGVDGVAQEARTFCHVATNWFSFANHVIHLLKVDADAFAVEREREKLKSVFSPCAVYASLDEALHDI